MLIDGRISTAIFYYGKWLEYNFSIYNDGDLYANEPKRSFCVRKAVFLILTITIIAALLVPFLNFGGSGESAEEVKPTIARAPGNTLSGQALPFEQIVPEVCTLRSSFKEEWDTMVCETFDDSTTLWEGSSYGMKVYLEDGVYVVDNSDPSGRLDAGGYAFPILVGAAKDVMLAVKGSMECLEGDCAWGLFVRSTTEAIVYVFMIDDEGSFSLTGLTSQETAGDLGNIQRGSHVSILQDGENTITAVVEGAQMMFFVNDMLLAEHKAYDANNPTFGLIVWGGADAMAVNRFNDVLARAN